MVANFSYWKPGKQSMHYGIYGEELEDFEADDVEVEVLEVSDISIQTPAVSDNLLGMSDEFDSLLEAIDLESDDFDLLAIEEIE